HGRTLLMLAAHTSVPLLELLLARGIEVNARDEHGRTALMLAVEQHLTEAGGVLARPELAQLLLAHGADLDAQDEDGRTAVMQLVSAWRVPVESVQPFLERGADVNAKARDGTTALMLAVRARRTDLATLLLAHGAHVTDRDAAGDSVLRQAIE